MSDNTPAFPEVVYWPSVFTVEECHRIVNEAKNLDFNEGGFETDGADYSVRKGKIVFLPRNETFLWAYERILQVIYGANEQYWHFEFNRVEQLQLAEYSADNYYDWHLDMGRYMPNCQRKLSVSVQLSAPSDYEGGDVEFKYHPKEATVATKEQGSVVVFPSYILHRVTPVTRGARYSLVQWALGSSGYR